MPQKPIIIPETWDTLEEFAHWFRDNGFPMRVPADMQVYVTDNSYSCVVFRQDIYQVELYLVAPDRPGHKHSHGFEYMSIFLGGSVAGESQDRPENRGRMPSPKVPKNMPHQFSGHIGEKNQIGHWHKIDTFEQGAMMYIVQKWNSQDDMTSAIINYRGEPIGPIHNEMLKKIRQN